MSKVVIIGGVAGGASAAARLRRMREDFEIIMIDKGPYVSFANCGLPYYVGNVIKEKKSLELMTPSRFKSWFNIDVRVNNEAKSIDRDKKQVLVRDITNQEEYNLDYDSLVIATGSSPIIPSFPGLEYVPYHTIWTIPDAVKIRDFVDKYKIQHAVVVGGGFIGLEMAENLVKKGVKVKIVEMIDQVMPPIDKEMAHFIHQELILNGVCLILEDPVASFGRTEDDKSFVKTKSGRKINTDLIVLSVGIQPQNRLAKEAGLVLGNNGHIIVNEKMITSDQNIYAVGDVVEVKEFQTKEPIAIALAGPANKQGRIAADNIAGKNVGYKGILGSSVVKVFDATVASVGLTEKMLKETNLKFNKVYVHPNNHAGYYPGATPLTFKLMFEDPSGKVLGAQIIGGSGAEKRADVISTIIKLSGTVFDLEELELTYAPPYGSAKDPVNMAGFIASNYLRSDIAIKQWHDIEEFKNDKGIILDVRTKGEYEARRIEGSTNIPLHELRNRLNDLSKDKPIIVYCEVGYRSYLATRILMQRGFNEVYELTGGFKLYEMANSNTEDIVAACGGSAPIMEEYVKTKSKESDEFVVVDCSGLACPGPLNAMIKSLEILPENKKLKIYATDPGFKSSVEAYAELNEAVQLLSLGKEQGKLVAMLEKANIPLIEVEIPTSVKKKSRKEMRGPNAQPLSDISAEELYERLDSDDSPAIIVDVRTPQEFYGQHGHIKSAKLFPLGELMHNIEALNDHKDDEVVVICHSGARSMMAARLLVNAGFTDVRNLTGGMMMWHRKRYPFDRSRN
jgi:NADPH-dependent 2,4-dienoyl-CoA reductase/sulfur reductase-like enzyme/rhodanese-related sulfurtransferase/TusA-related sulfurtransferase